MVFNQNTAHEELVKHALDKTAETGITATNQEKLKLALEEKEGEILKIKIETQDELNRLKTILTTKLNMQKLDAEVGTTPTLTEQEIKDVAKEMISVSEKTETEQNQLLSQETNLATPETPNPEPTSTEVAAAVAFFKEEGEFVETNTEPKETLGSRIGKYIKNALSGFFMSLKEMFGQDVSNEKAQIEGYKDALSKKKVEGMMSGLSPYVGGALDNASITKKEGLSKYIEGTGVPLVYISENGKQQIMIAPQVMKYVFEGKNPDNKLQNIIKNDETWANIQAVRGKYLSFGGDRSSLADISAIDRVKEIFTVEEGERTRYIARANSLGTIIPDSVSSEPILGVVPAPFVDPEVQNNTDLKEAEESQAALEKVKDMPETSESEKKTKEEALKKATEKVDTIKNREKGIMLAALEKTDEKLADSIRRKSLLEAGDKEKNKLEIAKFDKEIKLYTESQKAIKAKIDSVMITADSKDKWSFKDTSKADEIILARIGIQSILEGTLDTSTKRETSEVSKTNVETISEEVDKLSQEMSKNAADYKDATPERKIALKAAAMATLGTIKQKNTQAITENTIIQQNALKNKEDTVLAEQAQKSDKAAKQITETLKKAQEVMNKIETEGASELAPLNPRDPSNLVYIPTLGKLFQHNGSTYKEVGYVNNKLGIAGNLFQQQDTNLRSEYEKDMTVIPYSEANNIIAKWAFLQQNLTKGEWLYVPKDVFASRLRKPIKNN